MLKGKNENLLLCWQRLEHLQQFIFHAKTKPDAEYAWNGKGRGEIVVAKDTNDILIFNEEGFWQNTSGSEIHFKNVFRWTLKKNEGLISLEHLRQGADHPVFLFDLAPVDSHSLSSVEPHHCGADCYFGKMHFNTNSVDFYWYITGPKKDTEINYSYS